MSDVIAANVVGLAANARRIGLLAQSKSGKDLNLATTQETTSARIFLVGHASSPLTGEGRELRRLVASGLDSSIAQLSGRSSIGRGIGFL